MRNSGTLKIHGMVQDMPLVFEVVEFHFTTPAEHSYDGLIADMEMQIVYNINTEYLPYEEELITRKLIVSVLFQASQGANNTFINSLNMNTLGYISQLTLPEFISNLPDRFVFYKGSISRPPCTENVYRIVYLEIQKMSTEQLRYFTQYYQKNARYIQSANERTILKVTTPFYSIAMPNKISFLCVILIVLTFLL